jgi:hypothetical protein
MNASDVYDRRFQDYLLSGAQVEKLYTGMLWAEGPATSTTLAKRLGESTGTLRLIARR